MNERKIPANPTNLPNTVLPTDVAATISSAWASIDTSQTGMAKVAVSNAFETHVPMNFGRYKIEKELGKGAMGIVYLAEDTTIGRKVALKIPKNSILNEPGVLERFYREAKIAGQIRHPNICPVYDVGAIDGIHYLTMAYISGKPVISYLSKGKLPAAKQVALLIRKIALALEEAHNLGIVHRDLKPSNVMLDDRGEPIVMDFGLARNSNTDDNARLTQSGAILGTPAYMAPEQMRGDHNQIGPQSDIYALGVMMYQLLTGVLPFEGPLMLVFAQVLRDQPKRPSELRPDVDPTLEAICLKMMAKEIEQRYGRMKDVSAALSEFIKSGSMTGQTSTSTLPTTKSITKPSFNLSKPPKLPDFVGERQNARTTMRAKSPAVDGAALLKNSLKRPWFWPVAGTLGAVFLLVLLAAVLNEGKGHLTDTKDVNLTPRLVPNDDKREGDLDENLPEVTNRSEEGVDESIPVVSRSQFTVIDGKWWVKDDELVHTATAARFTQIVFGDASWQDYDFTIDFLRGDGDSSTALIFREDARGFYLYGMGLGTTADLCVAEVFTNETNDQGQPLWWSAVPRKQYLLLQNHKWYTARVRVRGNHFECFLRDGNSESKVFDFSEDRFSTGRVGLRCGRSTYHFKNIKVTAPDGKVLWDGAPAITGS